VSVDRLHALLLLRIGDERAGTAALEIARSWAHQTGYVIEQALARHS